MSFDPEHTKPTDDASQPEMSRRQETSDLCRQVAPSISNILKVNIEKGKKRGNHT
jgi:hypothetical protein